MPRLSKSLPKYRKHKKSGQAFVELNGRRHYLGPHNTKASKLLYDQKIAEWLASGRSATFGLPQPSGSRQGISVLELCVKYLTHAKDYYGDGHRSPYRNVLYALRPLRSLYPKKPVRKFRPRHLEAVREKMVELGWSRKHINSCVRKIRKAFRWGVTQGLVPVRVAQALSMIEGLSIGHTKARETAEVQPVPDTLVDATLPFLSPVVKAMVELQRATGMRPGEVCILTPQDVDRTNDVWEYRPSKHKNTNKGKDRTVPFGPKAKAIIAPFLLRAPDSFCFSPAEAVGHMRAERTAGRTTPKSCGNNIGTNRKRKPKRQPGQRYTTGSFYSAVRCACDKAFPVPVEIAGDADAVTKWRKEHRWAPNRQRHSLGTKVREKFGLEASRVLLGHSTTRMTETYAKPSRKLANSVAKKIG